MSSSSSTSSPLCPGPFDSQRFHRVFPTALPRRQRNILYAAVLQQPSLVLEIKQQSLYEEDESLQSLVRIFHHLVSTQMYLANLEPRTDHILSSTLHLMSAVDDMLDLLHDHGFHHHILSLPPRNLTLACLFRPIYRTLTVIERDAYEESNMRLINRLASPPFVLPVPAPPSPTPTEPFEGDPVPSSQSISLTLINELTDPCPAFHQGHTASYPTQVAPHNPRQGPQPVVSATTVYFHCHDHGHFRVDCPEYKCPHCRQHAPGHPQYRCSRNYCSFCWRFGHLSRVCPDWCCALCDDPGHVIGDCPFSEDPSQGIIVNEGDPEGL